MEYRYKKNQIFRKKLSAPTYIINAVYNCRLSLVDYFKYDLHGKIPTSCIVVTDRVILEKFGVEKCRNLDWELIYRSLESGESVRDVLMSLDKDVEDINKSLYERVKNKMKPRDYSAVMRSLYPGRFFEMDGEHISYDYDKYRFNDGVLPLNVIIDNWKKFKEKDISLCLINDKNNTYSLTAEQVQEFMNKHIVLVPYFLKFSDPYSLIGEYYKLESEDERKLYIKGFTDDILSHTNGVPRRYGEYREDFELENSVYREIFKYSSLAEHLKRVNKYRTDTIIQELKELGEDYIYDMPIPLDDFFNDDVLDFIGEFGLKNVVDFDNECGHFFTNNNCRLLKLMFEMYMHYGSNQHDPTKSIYSTSSSDIRDEEGKYLGRRYTKEEFYESMRRMIVNGPSNWDYAKFAPDYRDVTGEFRNVFSELFISDEADEELQKCFYTKSITPRMIYEHPEYIPFLKGKDLSSCFKNRSYQVDGSKAYYRYENFYNFLLTKIDFDGAMKFISEYYSVFELLDSEQIRHTFSYDLKFDVDDNISDVADKIHSMLRKVLVEKRLPYPEYIPSSLKDNYPSMFLSDSAPDELKEIFYSRVITTKDILNNPEYIDYLKNVDLELIFRPMDVITDRINFREKCNLTSLVSKVFGQVEGLEVMLLYGKCLEEMFDAKQEDLFKCKASCSKEELLVALDEFIYKGIVNGIVDYDENMSEHFKNRYPNLFLSSDVDKKIRDKFYSREFTLKDFDENPELIDIFGNTNVICGMSKEYAWMIKLFEDDGKLANYNRLKVLSEYVKIEDAALRDAFCEFVLDNDELDMNKIKYAAEVLQRISRSNSVEIFTFRKQLAGQVLRADNPLECLSTIEDIFIKSNIPTVGKIYSCFETLHPNFEGFDFNYYNVSPMLKNSSTRGRKVLVFSDLIKAAFGSNNRSVNSYLDNIEVGSRLYLEIRNGRSFDELSDDEKNDLVSFSKHLATLYNNTLVSKEANDVFVCSDDVVADLETLAKKLSVDGSIDYNLGDRVVRMFCGFAGIDTLSDAREYILGKVSGADSRNRRAASKDMILEKGDYVKGIGGIFYLGNILQNGSVAKEFLGASATSDSTPLDTDVSKILTSDGTTREKLSSTAASGYGPIYFVLKDDSRFVTTRTHEALTDEERDRSKLEVFHTGSLGNGHYGIRTGFASSEINYIVMDSFDPRVGLEIAMNGFYIPVANMDGKIIFTPEDYDLLRSKMNGLSYFGENEYNFSSNLVTDEVLEIASQIENSNLETKAKREKINAAIRSALEELGLKLKTEIDGDLTEGYVELIDTGSTGRGTNKPGDGDFDMMMRLDRTIMLNPEKLSHLKKTILKHLGRDGTEGIIATGDFRLKDVLLDDIDVDIDITFAEKTDKVLYSTDMALQDRMEVIRRSDPEKYELVVANILLAKEVLKEAGVYKPNRGEVPQGGLGGVGVENWILQNGGSFIDAARSFVEASEGRSFEEFKSSYYIWDFGDNHLAERRRAYVHDNFVENNMSEEGYHKMVEALTGYLKKIDKTSESTDSKKI